MTDPISQLIFGWRNKVLVALCCGLFILTACGPSSSDRPAPILLFIGNGTSPNDVRAVERILDAKWLSYSTVDSSHLNAMTEGQLLAHRLLIIPGGNYLTMSAGFTPDTATNIHNAVQNGLNYLGICAGGLMAGNAATNSLNLTTGVRVGFYAAVNRGIHKTVVPLQFADATTQEHYWEDGPHFNGWGEIVARYPDGSSAIVEGRSGKGWVILCGTHPEAPEVWRRGMSFTAPASIANAYAGTLVEAAFHGTSLSHFR